MLLRPSSWLSRESLLICRFILQPPASSRGRQEQEGLLFARIDGGAFKRFEDLYAPVRSIDIKTMRIMPTTSESIDSTELIITS